MIIEPGEPNSVPLVAESTHEQTYDELTEKEVKQIEANDQAIQTILMGLSEDIYDAVDRCDTAQEIRLRVELMKKGSSIGVQEKKANVSSRSTISTYPHETTTTNNNYIPQPSFNMNYMQQPMPNPEDISDPTIAMNMALVLMAKAFKLNYSTPTNNNQRTSSNPRWGKKDRYRWLEAMNVRNQNGLIVVLGNANQNVNRTGNGNVVAARAGVNGNGNNGNKIRCYNFRGLEAEIQLQAEEFDLMAAAWDIDEIEEMDQLSMEHSGVIVEQHPATVEETRAYFESLYYNLVTEVEKVNTVNRKMKETNADLTTELARYKGQEKSFEINKTKFDELETGYRKSVYQEQCLTKKINVLHLSSAKQITALNKEITNLNNQLSKQKSTVSLLQEEKKKLKSDFKTREDEFLDKLIQSEKKNKGIR
ncbi:hypothetical protein Tco_0939050 [Tanacetum coccineum]|uniref:Uncharacterized protein n=1 Tax=Tanacetum coccineum TaxID=301880 RepID=A0ABQ5DIY2_9ASTR